MHRTQHHFNPPLLLLSRVFFAVIRVVRSGRRPLRRGECHAVLVPLLHFAAKVHQSEELGDSGAQVLCGDAIQVGERLRTVVGDFSERKADDGCLGFGLAFKLGEAAVGDVEQVILREPTAEEAESDVLDGAPRRNIVAFHFLDPRIDSGIDFVRLVADSL